MFTHKEPGKTRLTSLEATWINTQTTFSDYFCPSILLSDVTYRVRKKSVFQFLDLRDVLVSGLFADQEVKMQTIYARDYADSKLLYGPIKSETYS